MTLNTTVYIHCPVDPHAVFHFCRDLLGATSQHPWYEGLENAWNQQPRRVRYGPDQGRVIPPRVILTKNAPMHLANEIGIGLNAILSLYYHPGRPLRTAEDTAQHTPYCNVPSSRYYAPDRPDCDPASHEPPCWLELSFDTAYGYMGPNGESCSMLHARYMVHLLTWLEKQDNTFTWHNEYTSEYHQGAQGLEAFIGSGDAARAWLRETVMPAIPAHAATPTQGLPPSSTR